MTRCVDDAFRSEIKDDETLGRLIVGEHVYSDVRILSFKLRDLVRRHGKRETGEIETIFIW